MAPPEKRNFMEDVFWRKIDQWGADNLSLLRSSDPTAALKLDKRRLIIYLMSFEYRNPRKIAELKALANDHDLGGCMSKDYATHRYAHEPATFEEFESALNLPGLTELTATMLCKFVKSPSVRDQLLSMEWQLVDVKNSIPILTSDVPLIRYKALRDDDGMMVLPVSYKEFFVAYNRGKIDMLAWMESEIMAGRFIEWINRTIIEQKIDYVYAVDESLTDFVARHWDQ